jgi:hypothetical protein
LSNPTLQKTKGGAPGKNVNEWGTRLGRATLESQRIGIGRATRPLESGYSIKQPVFHLGFKVMKTLLLHPIPAVLAVVLASSATTRLSTLNRFPNPVRPGEFVTILWKTDPTENNQEPVVKLHSFGSDRVQILENKTFAADQIIVKLPDDLELGRYYLTLDYDDLISATVPGELRVQVNEVQLDDVPTVYRNVSGLFDFDVTGHNFSLTPYNNQIYVLGDGPIIKRWSVNEFGCRQEIKNSNLTCLWVESREILHVVGYKAKRVPETLTFRVGSGNSLSRPGQLALSSSTYRSFVVVSSVSIFLVLASIIFWLVTLGMRVNVIHARHPFFWSAFLDKRSNSYSLSKFQFLLFFCLFVHGYTYVLLCRWFAQGWFAIPDVPSQITAIFAISAGTRVVAARVGEEHGSTGGAPHIPSVADFVSIRGQLAADRVQFFVWTLIACVGYWILLLTRDPTTLRELPPFPNGLLYIAGVSGVGYTAGGYLRTKLSNAAGDRQ